VLVKNQTWYYKIIDLESRISNMDKITNKIENLEQEIIKRNPTEVEKIRNAFIKFFPL
jgi:hypothetical protein